MGIDMIQQWQYIGGVPPELLADEALENAKRSGITSLQSYVTWREIEPAEGKIDFSSYDPLVEQCEKHGLKWLPFIILGPNYSVPEWFHESDKCVYAACLEHGTLSRIQSIWNPHLLYYVERFLKLLAGRYSGRGVVDGVSLGISGNWGESLYPIEGCFYPGFHTHLGWWCGDRYALASYREYLERKYQSIRELNAAYKKHYNNFSSAAFPCFFSPYAGERAGIGAIWTPVKQFYEKYSFIVHRQIRKRFVEKTQSAFAARFLYWKEWHDFVEWYTGEMTRWADFWIGAARKFFPRQRIYLVTGGSGWPEGGANFSDQVKAAVKHGAGMRITNQSDTFADSFILARLVSTAARFYGAYYNTEEAWINTPNGVTARIFDAASSGANGFYCKNIIGTGFDICTKKEYPVGVPTGGAENLLRYGAFITGEKPEIEVAVLFPTTSIILGTSVGYILEPCKKLREKCDFDLVDETMIRDGILERYRFLVILSCKWLRESTLAKIQSWEKKGGIIINYSATKTKNIDNPRSGAVFEMHEQSQKRVTQENKMDAVFAAITNKTGEFSHQGPNCIDAGANNVYASFMDNRIMLLNENDEFLDSTIRYTVKGKAFQKRVTCGPRSIVSIQNFGE